MRIRNEVLVLVLILAVAAALRLTALDTVPPGLHAEEAVNGTAALSVRDADDGPGPFTRLQSLAVGAMGPTARALRTIPALAGILTVLGTYLLARRLFNRWDIAALGAVLMATGFWHIGFSRLGISAVLAPALGVWSLYLLYTALTTNRLWHWGLSGALMGLGLSVHGSFATMPFVALVVLVAYWHSVHKDFAHQRYAFTRSQLAGGVALALALFVAVAAPLVWQQRSLQPDVSSASTGQERDIGSGSVRTLAMFVMSGDPDWSHGIAGEPVLFWPVAALFAVGLGRSLLKVGRVLRTHGHFSAVHALLLAWFFIGLIPAVLSARGIPDASLALVVAPAAYIFAAEGLWWLYGLIWRAYAARDSQMVCIPEFLVPGSHGHRRCTSRSLAVALFTLCVFLLAVAVHDITAYFRTWANHPFARAALNADAAGIAARIRELPRGTKIFVLMESAERQGSVPPSAHAVMFLTDTGPAYKGRARDITYLRPDEFSISRLPRGAVLFRLP